MEFNQFIEKTKKAIQDYLGEEATVMVNQITKNNGVILEGLSIMEKEKNISPTIYLNSFYNSYEEGESFSDIVKRIVDIYKQNKIEENINMDFFMDYDKVKQKIVYKLINYDKNTELLEDIPYVKYLDLAIVFYCMVTSEQIGNASILIHNKHCAMWDVTLEDIYSIAEENTPRLLPSELRNMEDVLCQIMREKLEQEYHASSMTESEEEQIESAEEWTESGADQIIGGLESDNQTVPMYVLSNRTRVHGAACILYQGVVSKFADDLQKDLYILPSSIHETILIPAENLENSIELNEMVREVNMTQVDAEEILADHAYYYSRTNKQVNQI